MPIHQLYANGALLGPSAPLTAFRDIVAPPFNTAVYNGSVGGAPQLVDLLGDWGSTSGIIIAVLYVASLCYIIVDYFGLLQERRAAEMNAATEPAGNRIQTSDKPATSAEERFSKARGPMGASAGLLTPSQPPTCVISTPSYTREELIKAHGVKHIAVIMDGNRRFGKMKAAEKQQQQDATELSSSDGTSSPTTIAPSTANSFITRSRVYRNAMAVLRSVGMGEKVIGHKAGGEKLLDFARYCINFNVPILTVYAFSTENWGRPQEEIDILMALFTYFFEQMREESHKNGIFCRFIVGDATRLNPEIIELMKAIERDTRAIPNRKITVNVCVSYGSRLEIAQACQRLAADGVMITEEAIASQLMTSLTEHEAAVDDNDNGNSGGVNIITNGAAEAESLAFIRANDPDILFRTSGESRISNFLLYQCAYSEMIFSTKAWPAIEEEDVESLLVEYCCRHRRFGR